MCGCRSPPFGTRQPRGKPFRSAAQGRSQRWSVSKWLRLKGLIITCRGTNERALKLERDLFPTVSGLVPQGEEDTLTFSEHLVSSLVAQSVKNQPVTQETWVRSLGREDSLEKGMTTYCSVLTWRIPWTEEPSRLQSLESQRVGHGWVANTHTHVHRQLTHAISFTSHLCGYVWENRINDLPRIIQPTTQWQRQDSDQDNPFLLFRIRICVDSPWASQDC